MEQELEIGDRTFFKILSAELISSRETGSDVLTVQFPKWSGFTRKKIEKGMDVRWKAGYSKYGLISEFVGTVTEISQSEPMKIICRDRMYSLQSQTMKKNLNGELKKIIPEINPNFMFRTPKETDKRGKEIETSSFKVNIPCCEKSKAWALRQLQAHGIDSFFRDNFLIIQKPALLAVTEDIKIFEKGFNVIEDSLVLRMNRPIRVKLKSYDSNAGLYNTAVFPESLKDAEEKLIELDGIPKKQIQQRAKEIFMEIAGPGLRGSFTTFGYPSVAHSEIIWFRDPKVPDKNKAVFVTKVEKNYDASAASYRQKIHLDIIEFKLNSFKELPEKFKKKLGSAV